jgi:heme A synthase
LSYQRYLLLLSIVSTYILIVWGAYLTAGNWGGACGTGTPSDWPACNGSFAIPLHNWGALVEYIHRTLSVVTAVFLVVTTVAVLRMNPRPRVTSLALVFSLLLLFVQILLGAVVVNTDLDAVVTALHLATATALFGLLVLAGVTMAYSGSRS